MLYFIYGAFRGSIRDEVGEHMVERSGFLVAGSGILFSNRYPNARRTRFEIGVQSSKISPRNIPATGDNVVTTHT